MGRESNQKLSVFISLILRHKPETIGICLDEHGWADVQELLRGINQSGRKLDMARLEEIVRTDEKQRYSFSSDKALIRANQGHSIPVDVELERREPPEILYHGTAERFLPKIFQEGLKPMGRLYVHLSGDSETAVKVGARHGRAVVLSVSAGEMAADGSEFYQSQNGVWLTKKVLPKYLTRLSGESMD